MSTAKWKVMSVPKVSSTSLVYDTNVKNLKWEFSFRRDIKYKKPLKSPYHDQELLNHWHRTKEIYTIKKYEKLLSSF